MRLLSTHMYKIAFSPVESAPIPEKKAQKPVEVAKPAPKKESKPAPAKNVDTVKAPGDAPQKALEKAPAKAPDAKYDRAGFIFSFLTLPRPSPSLYNLHLCKSSLPHSNVITKTLIPLTSFANVDVLVNLLKCHQSIDSREDRNI